jgi:hypothetical protein
MERYVSLLLRRFTVSEVRNQAVHHEGTARGGYNCGKIDSQR